MGFPFDKISSGHFFIDCMKFNIPFSSHFLTVILFLSVLSFLGSLVLSFILYNYATQYYRELNLTRLDPLGLTVYESDKNKRLLNFLNKITVVFFGDSRAEAWSEPSDLDRFEFINRGIGSQTTSQAIGRYQEHIVPLDADILVIQVGINDLKTIALFPHLKEEIVARCKANIEQIVTPARKQNIKVILSTIFPVGKLPLSRRLFWSKDVDIAIDEVNEFIDQLAADDVLIFDTKSVLANEKGVVKDEYSLDFLHLNERGYRALNQELALLLEQVN
ncbi:MAG: GDSL-type esterase/lipase family protein [Geitlerinemataceae cyanobacterium]